MTYQINHHHPLTIIQERYGGAPRRRLRLHDFPMWKNMTEKEVGRLLQIATVKVYSRGEVLFNPIDEPNRLYFLQLGQVMTYAVTPQGQKKILHIFSPGDAFGALLLGAVDGKLPWAEALEDTIVCSMDDETFKHFMMDCPNLCLDLFKYISQIHVEAMRRLRGLLHTKAEGRVVMALLEIGRRLAKEDQEEFTISEFFTQEDIGDMAGLVRTTVSESIAKLSKLGILRKAGRKVIVHRHRAEDYLQEFT